MLIATFNSTTEWAGNSIGFDGDAFTVEGLGELTADEVMLFDADGQLTWVSEETRDLIAASVPVSQAVSSPPPPAQTAQATPTAPPLGTPQPAKADPSAHAPDAPPVTKNHAETEDEPGTYVLVATFGPTTAWVGKTITREGDVFVLEGHGPISAQDVMEYGRLGHLVWAHDGLPEWIEARASGPQPRRAASPSAVTEPSSADSAAAAARDVVSRLGTKLRLGRRPLWVWGVIAAGLVGALLIVVFLPSMFGQSKTDKLVRVVKADLPKADNVLEGYIKAGDADAQGNTAEASALREEAGAQMDSLSDHISPGMRPDGKGALLYDAYANYLFDITYFDLAQLFEYTSGDSPRSSSDVLADLQKYRTDIDHYLLDLQ